MTRCLMTFDVEDWFQVENLRPIFPPPSWETIPRRVTESTRVILRLLAEYEIRSTFFVLGWVAEREPKLVRDIAEAGHEVACHGYGHILPMQLTPVQFRDDILRARHVLQEVSGQEIIGYRAPSFSIDRERLAILTTQAITPSVSMTATAIWVTWEGLSCLESIASVTRWSSLGFPSSVWASSPSRFLAVATFDCTRLRYSGISSGALLFGVGITRCISTRGSSTPRSRV
ncbi:MAG: hypothetical protein E6K68_06785 [Nitrospirae bacterium]|nr:MAG: hypothetical protein E6K68_06785 [Nitrospirota bacterium]